MHGLAINAVKEGPGDINVQAGSFGQPFGRVQHSLAQLLGDDSSDISSELGRGSLCPAVIDLEHCHVPTIEPLDNMAPLAYGPSMLKDLKFLLDLAQPLVVKGLENLAERLEAIANPQPEPEISEFQLNRQCRCGDTARYHHDLTGTCSTCGCTQFISVGTCVDPTCSCQAGKHWISDREYAVPSERTVNDEVAAMILDDLDSLDHDCPGTGPCRTCASRHLQETWRKMQEGIDPDATPLTSEELNRRSLEALAEQQAAEQELYHGLSPLEGVEISLENMEQIKDLLTRDVQNDMGSEVVCVLCRHFRMNHIIQAGRPQSCNQCLAEKMTKARKVQCPGFIGPVVARELGITVPDQETDLATAEAEYERDMNDPTAWEEDPPPACNHKPWSELRDKLMADPERAARVEKLKAEAEAELEAHRPSFPGIRIDIPDHIRERHRPGRRIYTVQIEVERDLAPVGRWNPPTTEDAAAVFRDWMVNDHFYDCKVIDVRPYEGMM